MKAGEGRVGRGVECWQESREERARESIEEGERREGKGQQRRGVSRHLSIYIFQITFIRGMTVSSIFTRCVHRDPMQCRAWTTPNNSETGPNPNI